MALTMLKSMGTPDMKHGDGITYKPHAHRALCVNSPIGQHVSVTNSQTTEQASWLSSLVDAQRGGTVGRWRGGWERGEGHEAETQGLG